jgi:DNA-binding MarR family transcriptional regulator
MTSPAATDYRAIDDHIHGRVRLAIMAYLSGADSAEFRELRDAASATDGNLSANLRRLEEAGYVEIAKSFVDRRPHTRVILTSIGREAWIAYLARMRAMLFPDQP